MSPVTPGPQPELPLLFGRLLLRRRARSGRPTLALRWWDASHRSYRLAEVPDDFRVDGVARAEAAEGPDPARWVEVAVAPGNRRQARDTLAHFRSQASTWEARRRAAREGACPVAPHRATVG